VPAEILRESGSKPSYYYPSSDVAGYSDIQNSLAEVWGGCVYGVERQIGWAVSGNTFALIRTSRG